MEKYIPCSRHTLANRLCKTASFAPDQERQFKSFCEILMAYLHHEAQKQLETMKEAYAHFDPNLDTTLYPTLDRAGKQQAAQTLADTLENILRKSNFTKFARETIELSLKQSSLIPVTTDVNFNDYERILIYYRGDEKKEVVIKNFSAKKRLW